MNKLINIFTIENLFKMRIFFSCKVDERKLDFFHTELFFDFLDFDPFNFLFNLQLLPGTSNGFN